MGWRQIGHVLVMLRRYRGRVGASEVKVRGKIRLRAYVSVWVTE